MADLTAAAAPQQTSLLKNRTFVALAIAHLISVVGDGFHSVALGLWVLQTTGSSTAMGAVMTVRILTTILLGAVAGTAVDRTDRRRLMIATDLIRVALVGSMALLVGAPSASLGLILALTGLTSIAGQFFNPTFQASLVNIVTREELPQASSALQVINTLGQVAGPFLGGMWVGFAGGPAALWVDALSFLASALLILLAGRFPSPRRQESEGASFWQDMKQGLLYLRTQPIIRSVAIIAPALNFFGNAIGGVLIPVLAVKVWLASSAQYGSLEGSFPLGFAIGAGLIMAFSSRLRRRGLLMFLSLLAGSLLFLVVPLMPTIGAVFPLSIGAGILMAVPNVLFQVLVQSEAPSETALRTVGEGASGRERGAPSRHNGSTDQNRVYLT